MKLNFILTDGVALVLIIKSALAAISLHLLNFYIVFLGPIWYKISSNYRSYVSPSGNSLIRGRFVELKHLSGVWSGMKHQLI